MVGDRTATVVPGATRSRAPASAGHARPKEGLALINGTQPSTAVWRWRSPTPNAGARGRHRRGAVDRRAARLDSSVRGAHPRRPAVRPASGVGRQIEALLRGSGINESHETAARCRTPTRALRGAGARRGARSAALHARRRSRSKPTARPTTRWCSPTTATSCPAATSTARRSRSPPTCSPRARPAGDDQRAADPIGWSTRRSSGLPAFLTRDGGLQSGLMMAQVTAAAVASEMKTLAHPAGVDTIPTSADKEDHVSMSMSAALKAARAVSARARGAGDRNSVRVPGDRPAGAAQNVAAARRACTHCATRVPTLTTIVRRRPTSTRSPTLIASAAIELACGMRVK